MFKKILVPTDASEYSKRALEAALDLARIFHAEVELLHVTYTPQAYWGYTLSYGISITQEDLNRNGEIVLESSLLGMDVEGIPLKMVLESGHPVTKIVDEISKEKIDLVVMGSRGYGPITGSVLGSISQRVLQKSPCPVLIIK